MITFWKQPGNKTLKRPSVMHNHLIHVSREQADVELKLLKELGFEITEESHKITAVRNTLLDSIDK